MSSRSILTPRPSIFDNKKRGCTDWPCLIIFIIVLILYLLFAIFVFREGSLRRFIYPSDTQGRICGIESQIDRNYLQFFDIIKCIKYVLIGSRCPTPQICVKECPSKFYHYKLLYAQELKLTSSQSNKYPQIRAQLSCQESARSQVDNPNISIYTLVKERKLCAPYAFPSAAFYGRCIPSVIVTTLNLTIQQADDVINNRGGNSIDNDVIPSKDPLQDSLQYFKKALQIKRLLSYMLDDLVRSRFILLLSLLFAMLILIVYMILLRYFAECMVWLSLVSCILVFALAAIFCFTIRARMGQQNNNNSTLPQLAEMNVTFDPNAVFDDQTETISTTGKVSAFDQFDTAMILLDEFAPMRAVWLVLGIFCCIVCGILLICTCCLWERLSLAAALIKEASKAICHALTILLWPIFTFTLNILVFILGILIVMHYSTLGQPIYQISCSQDFGQSCRTTSSRTYVIDTDDAPPVPTLRALPTSCFDYREGDHCQPDDFAQLNCSTDRIRCVYVSYGFVDTTFEAYLNSAWSHRFAEFLSRRPWFINILNLFVVYWLLAFAIALEEMVLACTFASYYWEAHRIEDKCCRGYFNECLCWRGISLTVRHHLGTIAFGSSIVAIIDTLRTMIDLIKDRLETISFDGYGKCCLTLVKGCLGCVRCCFKFFSRYAYIMTAVSGKWFCPAAFTATKFLLNNCLRVFVLDRVCAVLLYIGRITVTIGSCVFTAFLIDRIETSVTLHFSWFPILIVGLIVYTSSAIFLNVYSTATSTLFFCVLYDLELHDGSQMQPYAMSNHLRQILSKSHDFTSNRIEKKEESTSAF